MKNSFRSCAIGSIACVIALTSILFACSKDHSYYNGQGNGSGNTAVHVFLTDDPSLIFDHVFIDIQKVEIKAEDNNEMENEREHQGEADDNDQHGDVSGGWVTLNIHPGVYDILNFRNGLDTILATGNFPSTNELKKVRITLGNNNSVVFNGASFPLFVQDENNIIVIKLDDSFSAAGSLSQFDFTLDFDAGLSISLHGDKFELRSHVKAFREEKSGRIEGRVLPADAHAVVFAMQGADTVATTKPESEGEFKIGGLKAGNYSVVFHATANAFQDTTVQNVSVAEGEDAHTGSINLHQ